MAGESPQEKSRNLVSSAGFAYLDASSNEKPTIHSHLMNQMQSFESNPELFNLTTGIDMLGFPSKNLQERENNLVMWKGLFIKPENQASSSSKTITGPASDFYQAEFNKPDFSGRFSETTGENLMVAPESGWQDNRLLVDDSSLRCVFPCEANERPSQGLSLSLSSTRPSGIGLQSFEMRESIHHHQPRQSNDIRYVSLNSRDGFFEKSANLQQQQQILQDGYFGKAANIHQVHFQLKNSKYLATAQELLNEICSLGSRQTDPSKQKLHKSNQWEDENGCPSQKQPLHNLDLLELQKRKAKLLSMLEEVDRRYRQYCDQMKAVVSSFEAVAGTGTAKVYSALASKAMSKHFRSLRDAIVGQIKATKKAMGEKDPVAPGTTRGETPRLRLLDQTLRQQRAFQQMSMMESHPWRPQRGLPERSVSLLRAWLFEHFLHLSKRCG
uniref:POX domain-containing protein n=1 Tax=Nelumbo nucifera TaxID=4432 RepID=A0A822ZQY0_NELNU|nr:TPA_asm: hypothetical protein HUJ06_017210 [Nelumbo nucifera]